MSLAPASRCSCVSSPSQGVIHESTQICPAFHFLPSDVLADVLGLFLRRILLDTVNVSDYIYIGDATIAGGKISLGDARVGRSVHIDKCRILESSDSEGIGIDLVSADVGRELQVYDCNVEGDLRGLQARIGELRIVDSDIDGNITMQRIHITGPAHMSNLTVEGYIDAINSFVESRMFVEDCQVNGAGISDNGRQAFDIVGARIVGGMIFKKLQH